MPDLELFKMLNDGCLVVGRITLVSFVINTCSFILEQYDKDEGVKVIGLISEYVRDCKD